MRLPLGISDFCTLRQSQALYVDKTASIADVLKSAANVTLFCRPRRFGKTLFLSTLRYFVEATPEDRSALFHHQAIWEDLDARRHFQRYPVIWLSLKEVKGSSWSEAQTRLERELQHAAESLAWLEAHPMLTQREQRKVGQWLDGTIALSGWEGFLRDASQFLRKATGKQVCILIDEYDTPIHSAWTGGYYDKMVSFFRSFFGSGLKDNPNLHKAVLTGILRVAREGMFSSLNNLEVVSVLDRVHTDAFGFTEAEVGWLQAQVGGPHTLSVLKDWYNGYHIGTSTVYNPWSILSCLSRPESPPAPYWIGTGSTDQLGDQLWKGDAEFLTDLQGLLQGEKLERLIPDATPLPGMGLPELRSLLLHAGYYTATEIERLPTGWRARLSVPNRDVIGALYGLVQRWVQQAQPSEASVRSLVSAIVAGHVETFQQQLEALVTRALSFHELADPNPERIFHAFVLGLLVLLESTHRVWSNLESGEGRADVLVIPKQAGAVGVVLEFKKVRGAKEVAGALKEALEQIESQRYTAKLVEAEAGTIHAYAVVFYGKKVAIQKA
jgi:hypothetical protein